MNNDQKNYVALINYVPAIAVRRKGRALLGITGRKGFVGCKLKFFLLSINCKSKKFKLLEFLERK